MSGETTSGGLARLPRALRLHQPASVILELGANDGLRGLPLETLRANLAEMMRLARDRRGARAARRDAASRRTTGRATRKQFARHVPGAGATNIHLPLVPFLLEGVALDPRLMQQDGLHPNARGEPLVLDTVWPYLKPTVEEEQVTGAALMDTNLAEVVSAGRARGRSTRRELQSLEELLRPGLRQLPGPSGVRCRWARR